MRPQKSLEMRLSLRYFLFFIAVLCQFTLASGRDVYNVDSLYDELDALIVRRPEIIAQKEQKLNDLRRTYQEAPSPEQRFTLAQTLFSEYQWFQSDSTLHYALLLEDIAHELGDISYLNEARILQALSYRREGIFNESVDILRAIDVHDLTREQTLRYYQVRSYVYSGLMAYTDSNQHIRDNYCAVACESFDSICAMTSEDSFMHEETHLKRQLHSNPNSVSPQQLINLLSGYDIVKHHASVIYSQAAWLARYQSDYEMAKYYYAQSVIWDIETSTRETTSALALAELLFQEGDIERAWRYVKLAQNDARTFGSKIRLTQTSPVTAVISQAHDLKMKDQQTIGLYVIVVGLLLLIVLIAFIVRGRRKNRQQKQLSEDLRDSLEKQKQSAQQLAELNSQLSDAVEIKNRYIFESLSGSPGFVNEVERACITAEKRLIAKQYSEVLAAINSIDIKRERERQLSAFDTALLRLFPTFLVEYNELFPVDGQVHISDNGSLPTEVRIFALMRLGITDTERVALYLNISTNSLYVYKAKARARSLVDKNEFDKKVMNIGKAAA